jgi:DNA-binding IclR family transcriptional regulator
MHETSQTVRIVPRLGHRLPAYCTASGKVQLAYESRDHLAQIFEGQVLKKHTPNTIDNFDKLVSHLKEVARLGYAIDNEEWEEGVRCVGAPVRDYSHRVVAGVGLAGPVSRFSMERIEKELVPLVKEAASKISQRLGYELGVAAAR